MKIISRIIIVILVVLSNLSIQAQTKEEKKLLREALVIFDQQNFDYALPLFLELHEMDSTNPEYNLYVAICYLNSNTYRAKSLPYAIDAAASDEIPEAYYYLGKAYHLANDFDEAINAFKKFETYFEGVKRNEGLLSEVGRDIKMIENAKYFFNNPINANIVNIGEPINSKYAEYAPFLSLDGSSLIFTYRGKGSTGGKRDLYGHEDPKGQYMEDVYIAERDENEWDAPKSIGDNINSDLHDACVGEDMYRKTLYLFKNDVKGAGDIWESQFAEGEWQKPTLLPAPITSQYWEGSATITPDGTTLYFSSDRPGGKGGKDLYVTKKLATGAWGTPKNLGPSINTPYDEDAPFIYAGTNTLYFSSTGHNSMGGYDIFKSTLNGSSWQKAENLGFPINTTDDDSYFILTEDGEKGYFSSERVRNCFGQQDIYYVTWEKPEEVLAILKGKVTKNGKGIKGTTITVRDAGSNEIVSTNDVKDNGKYIISLPVGASYILEAKADEEPIKTLKIDLSSQTEFSVHKENFTF